MAGPCLRCLRGRAARADRVCESAPAYRPRHPERTPLYRLFERHFERYERIHEERFAPRDGPLRSDVRRSVEAYLDCGRLHGGFARIRCPTCKGEHLLAFSCQTRNFCPSCQAKRAALFAEHVCGEVLAPVAHRHYVFTVPRVLRGLFQRDRRLLGLLSRCAYRAVRSYLQEYAGRRDALPGMVASLQTFGASLNWHPHVHALVSEGLLVEGGGYVPVAAPDAAAVEELFRRLVIRALVRARRLSREFARRLLGWRHSGFSVHARQVVTEEESARTEKLARYLTRPPLALGRLRSAPDGAFLVQTPPDPQTGATTLRLEPLELIHRLVLQIPARGQHLVRYYGAYANRVRRRYRADAEEAEGVGRNGARDLGGAESEFTRERRRSWARLLRKVLEVEPLLCPQCSPDYPCRS